MRSEISAFRLAGETMKTGIRERRTSAAGGWQEWWDWGGAQEEELKAKESV